MDQFRPGTLITNSEAYQAKIDQRSRRGERLLNASKHKKKTRWNEEISLQRKRKDKKILDRRQNAPKKWREKRSEFSKETEEQIYEEYTASPLGRALRDAQIIDHIDRKVDFGAETRDRFESANTLDKLKMLKQVDLQVAAELVSGMGPRQNEMVISRLEKYHQMRRDGEKTESSYGRERLLTQEDVQTGFFRDLFYIAMIETPEYAAYSLTKKKLSQRSERSASERLFSLRGYGSDLFRDEYDNQIGNFELLCTTYSAAYKEVQKKYYANNDEEFLEHKAVRLAARWYELSTDYERATYGGYEDKVNSIVWARLGKTARKRLNGMLKKKYHPFNNLKRFIGRSGETEKSKEKRLLHGQIKQLESIVEKIQNLEQKIEERKNQLTEQQVYAQEGSAMKKLQEIDAIKAEFEWSDDLDEDIVNEMKARMEKKINEVHERYESEWNLERERVINNDFYVKDLKATLNEHIAEASEFNHSGKSRSPRQILTRMQKRYDELNKDPKIDSLADKAIDLANEFPYEQYKIDWINVAPVGLINWCSKALKKGVPKEEVIAYASARYIFGADNVTRSLLKLMKEYKGHASFEDLRHLNRRFSELNQNYYPETVLALSDCEYEQLFDVISLGYSLLSLSEYPWLVRTIYDMRSDNHDAFPIPEGLDNLIAERYEVVEKLNETGLSADEKGLLEARLVEISKKKKQIVNSKEQKAWCVRNAFYFPQSWNRDRLGNIMLMRLERGIDFSLHDASYWLETFEVPNHDEGKETIYKDVDLEAKLIASVMRLPENLGGKISTKKSKYADLFSSQSSEYVYEKALNYIKTGGVTYDELRSEVFSDLSKMKGDPRSMKKIKGHFQTFYDEVTELFSKVYDYLEEESGQSDSAPDLVNQLRGIGQNRNAFIDDAQRWVNSYAQTPRTLLEYAWQNRKSALAEGVQDNPRAIESWAKLNALRVSFDKLSASGRLPSGVKREDLLTYQDGLNQLVRHYGGEVVLRFLSEYKRNRKSEQLFSPENIALGDGEYLGEVLDPSDFRGATIGPQTGCCMTLVGASSDCIRAGYRRPDCGFFALSNDTGKLLAQSFIWVNTDKQPDTLVLDNIEANQGRDMGRVLKLYQEFFSKYIRHQASIDPNFKIRKVNIGTGYTEIGISHLPTVDPVEIPYNGYTDSYNQKRLLEISESEFNEIKPSIILDAHIEEQFDWSNFKEQIMEIEEKAFEGKGYSEEGLESEFNQEGSIVITIKQGPVIIGYTLALPVNEETMYVSSTAIHPDYQGNGYAKHLLSKLDEQARKLGVKYLEHDARVDDGYADFLQERYNVVELGEDVITSLGTQRRLVVEVPELTE